MSRIEELKKQNPNYGGENTQWSQKSGTFGFQVRRIICKLQFATYYERYQSIFTWFL